MDNKTMTSESTPTATPTNNTFIAQAGLGKRLRAARESLRISEKDAASRLRLNPKLIPLMENEDFDPSLPPTFMRGYIKSYMRLLNIPENEINEIVTKIVTTLPPAPDLTQTLKARPTNDYFRYMRWMTFVVAAALTVLVSMWWMSHPKDTLSFVKTLAPSKSIPTNEAHHPISTSIRSVAAPLTPAPAIVTPTPSTPITPGTIAQKDKAKTAVIEEDFANDEEITLNANTPATQNKKILPASHDKITEALDAANATNTQSSAITSSTVTAAEETPSITSPIGEPPVENTTNQITNTDTPAKPKHHLHNEMINTDNVYTDY